MSLMGVGTNSLGYSHPHIDKAVMKTLRQGNLSSLNCVEEVLLAEKLIELHPWAEMVKFARTGGEANAISIRIARAAAGRDTIAICGYHGWHDWYLATNLNNKNGLEEHLLSGLEPNGVPKSLKDSVKPFSFNNLEQLKNIVKNNKLAAIKMEVERSTPPKIGFLEAVREICDKEKIPTLPNSFVGHRYPLVFDRYEYTPCIRTSDYDYGPKFIACAGHEHIVEKIYINGIRVHISKRFSS